MKETEILFVVYTPYEGFLPKREAELKSRANLDKVDQVFVTPVNYTEVLADRISDTVHLIKLYPDSDVSFEVSQLYFLNEKLLEKFIETIKRHNI